MLSILVHLLARDQIKVINGPTGEEKSRKEEETAAPQLYILVMKKMVVMDVEFKVIEMEDSLVQHADI